MKFPRFINAPYIFLLIISLIAFSFGTILSKVLLILVIIFNLNFYYCKKFLSIHKLVKLICILILQKSKSELFFFKFFICFSNLL